MGRGPHTRREAVVRSAPDPTYRGRRAHLVQKLASIYGKETGYVLYREVPSSTGSLVASYAEEEKHVTRADGIAANTWPSRGWFLVLFEEKETREDFRRELRDLSKAAEIGKFCAQFFFVVRAPWWKIVFDLDELPEGVGLYEVDGNTVTLRKDSDVREAQPPSEGFLMALLRAGAEQGGNVLAGVEEKLVTFPMLSFSRVGLHCGHGLPKPLDKVLPRALPCPLCAMDPAAPKDREIGIAIVAESDAAGLDEIEVAIRARRAELAVAADEVQHGVLRAKARGR